MAPEPAEFRIPGPLLRADLPALYERACAQLRRADRQRLDVEVRGVAADAVAVDALARLELAARRHGCRVRLRGAGEDLIALIDLIGLHEVFFD